MVATPLSSFDAIGVQLPLRFTRIELHLLPLRLRAPVVSARTAHEARPLIVVHLVAEGPHGEVHGWGECAALADATYDPEDVGVAWRHLSEELLVDLAGTEVPPSPTSFVSSRGGTPWPLSVAAVEAALCDLHLRAEGRSLASALGVDVRHVEAGAVVGRHDRIDTLVDQVASFVAEGYRRVKVKIAPEWDLGPLRALRSAFPELTLQADANGSYGPELAYEALGALDDLGLACIEQPLAPDAAPEVQRDLARALASPVALDESVHSVAEIDHALMEGRMGVVCLKPARLGGLRATLEGLSRWQAPRFVGGMFEGPFARGVLATVSASAAGEVGDLSSPETYLATAALGPTYQASRRPEGGVWVTLPDVAGLGVPFDPVLVAGSATRSAVLFARTQR